MSLKDKAMSPFEIRKSLNMTWEKGFKTPEEFTAWTKKKEKERWVPLVDAQKEINELQSEVSDANDIAMGYKAKIEAANKILTEFDVELFNTGETKADGTVYYNFNIDKTFKQLKEALLIPRKEESKLTCDKAKEPPCHLEPSTELCGKCPLDKEEVKLHE